MNAILSIKPQYADAIFSGLKKVEFRKFTFKKDVEKVFVYSTSPVKKIIGYFTFNTIVENSPQILWEQFGRIGFIGEDEFFKYFENKNTGFSICIESTHKFSESIDPYKEFKNFIPPQSFCYATDLMAFFASGGQGLFLKKPPLDPAKTFD
jgi:predicted transcriptional regulator